MTKVFQVVTEYCEGDSNKITKSVEYVTAENDSMLLVVEHYTRHCYEYEKELISVNEAATIVQHIKEVSDE